MIIVGNVKQGAIVDCPFYSTTVLGVPITLVGGEVKAFEGNGAAGVATGITLSIDLRVTGSHHILVDTSAYNKAKNYSLMVTAGTVDGVSMIGYVVGYFSVENRIVEGIKRNEALANFEFLMVDESDGRTAKTGLSPVTASVCLDGVNFVTLPGGASVIEIANGMYKINLSAADLNAQVLTLRFTAVGADARYITIVTSLG